MSFVEAVVCRVVTSSVGEARVWGRLVDHIGLGVVSARFSRDLLEEVLNRTQAKEQRSGGCRRT
jgi:hypothetical protein